MSRTFVQAPGRACRAAADGSADTVGTGDMIPLLAPVPAGDTSGVPMAWTYPDDGM